MVWLWIVGILVGLVVAVFCLRVGVVMRYNQTLALQVTIGWMSFAIGDKPKKEKKPPKKKKKEPEEKKKVNIPMILSGVHTLLPPVCNALVRTCRGIRFHPFTISYVIGGLDDPAQSAQLYGQCNALIWSVMPVLERLLDIPDPSIHLDVDFQTPNDQVQAHVGLSAHIGTLVSVLCSLLIPTITWYANYTNQHKKEPTNTKDDVKG